MSVSADHDALAHQALGRPLTAVEEALAAAMLKAFASGEHDFGGVAALLQQWGVARPSGAEGPWTLESLELELRGINVALDQAYAENGIGG